MQIDTEKIWRAYIRETINNPDIQSNIENYRNIIAIPFIIDVLRMEQHQQIQMRWDESNID